MPRNSSGVYSKPAGTTPSVGQVIDPVPWNALTTDLGNEITNSLPRDGSAPMTAPLKNADGTQALPSVTFSSDVTTGMYRKASGVGALVAGGVEVVTWSGAGVIINQTVNDDIDLDGHNLLNVNEGVPDYLTGLITVRTSATTITVGIGAFKRNGRYVKNTASMSKNINANWAAGSGSGGLDAGSLAASSTYHLHSISKDADGSFDWLYSLSVAAPTVPAGYTLVGRFWSVVTDASSVIRDYAQSGNKCVFTTNVQESNIGSNLAKSLVTWATAPNGLSVDMIIALTALANNVANATTDIASYDVTANSSSNSYSCRAIATAASTVTSIINVIVGKVRTNTSKQFYLSVSYTTANGTALGTSLGWEDYQLPRVGA
ncbi:hypothetical protein [Rhizobium leguminosarum]